MWQFNHIIIQKNGFIKQDNQCNLVDLTIFQKNEESAKKNLTLRLNTIKII